MYQAGRPARHPHVRTNVRWRLAIGAPLALLFLKSLGKQSLLAVRDPRLDLSLKLTN